MKYNGIILIRREAFTYMSTVKLNKSEFDRLYYRCFDEDNNLKCCGRDACRGLLEYLNDEKYGSLKTNMLNVEAIVNLHNNL